MCIRDSVRTYTGIVRYIQCRFRIIGNDIDYSCDGVTAIKGGRCSFQYFNTFYGIILIRS